MAKKEKRFVVHSENLSLTESAQIIMDTKTGAQYLFVQDGYAGGLTPLLGGDGKPLLQPLSGAAGADWERDGA